MEEKGETQLHILCIKKTVISGQQFGIAPEGYYYPVPMTSKNIVDC